MNRFSGDDLDNLRSRLQAARVFAPGSAGLCAQDAEQIIEEVQQSRKLLLENLWRGDGSTHDCACIGCGVSHFAVDEEGEEIDPLRIPHEDDCRVAEHLGLPTKAEPKEET